MTVTGCTKQSEWLTELDVMSSVCMDLWHDG